MLKKLILTTALLTGLTYGASEQNNASVTTVGTKTLITEKTTYDVWKPTIEKKVSKGSCEDGNCISDLDCFTKDGVMYKMVTSVRDEIKRFYKKL